LGNGFVHAKQRFPSDQSKAGKALVAKLIAAIDEEQSLPHGPERVELEAKSAALAACIQRRAKPGKGGGLRTDLQILDPEGAFEVLTDITVLHPSKKTARVAEFKHASDVKIGGAGSPALGKKEVEKTAKYASLIAFTKKVRADAARPQPDFLVCAISTHGEFSKGCIELQEVLVRAFIDQKVREGDRPDGHTPEFLAVAFRTNLRSNLLVAAMEGTAMMISSAGLDRQTCRKYCRYGGIMS
jgi:hypothetical protein